MLSINVSELILTFASFYVMLRLMKRYLFKPLLDFMDERQARIDAGLEKEAQAAQRLESAAGEQQKALEKAEAQAQAHIEKGRSRDERALSAAEEQLRTARQRAEKLSRHENRILLKKSEDEIRAQAPGLSRTLAERLLGE